MSRQPQQIAIADLSAFTKSLRQALLQEEQIPGHARMLNMVSKAAGYKNHQHLKSNTIAVPKVSSDRKLERAKRVFANGMMTRWPKQTSVQGLCLWVLWAEIPPKQPLCESQINEILKERHSFGDHALLRRSMIDHTLLRRTVDGRIYHRVEQRPPREAQALIKFIQRPS
ncbi:DUF2087 domain-containing protein [Loktanella sp. S4079]|uniref:DUF2087 domain-containing protein n=1 Tax=Loktanella sp. S4079 TaxID=579483 RepID=UPI0005FA5BE6|nr:DUF2087 domain-containing protein [Loktanella sp. S4079]KJZ19966.1 hypothetical protein TW80_03665 [Loktanella sp. S4079]